MKKLMDLYQNNKFFGAMADLHIKPSGEWIDKINIEALDKYLYLSARKKIIFSDLWEEQQIEEAYRNICAILSTYDYKLDGLYDSMFFDYDPLVNYDRNETQTHNEQMDADDKTTLSNLGARSQTNTNGSRTDSSNSHTTAFDSADYGKATDSNNLVMGASTDTIATAAASDSVTLQGYQDKSSGGYHLQVKGNIGVTTSQQMLQSEREVRDFNFYNEVLRIFYDCILMSQWEV